jgi:ribonuclease Z
VRAFAVNHNTPALGFTVLESRHKLREEFIGKTGPELVTLKKQGVEIERWIEVPLLAYCGDSAEGDFLDLDYVNQANVIILECTFIEPDHVRRARAGYHVHVRDLPRILSRLKNEHVVLSHVTRRTFLRDAKAAVRKVLKTSDLDRVTFLMDRPPRQRESS